MFKLKNHKKIISKKIIMTGLFILCICFSYCYWWSRERTPLNFLSQWTDEVEKIKINKYKLWKSSVLQTDLYENTLKTIQYKNMSPALDSLDEIVLELNSKGSDCNLDKQDIINILYYTNTNFKNNLHSLSDGFTSPTKTNMRKSCEKLLSWCIMSAEDRNKNRTPDYISYCKSIVDYQFTTKSLNKEQLLSISENNKWSDIYRNNSLKDGSYDILNDVYVLSQIFFDSPEKPEDVLFYSMPWSTSSTSNWQNNNGNNWWSWWESWIMWWNYPIVIPFEPYHTPQEQDPEENPECNSAYNWQTISNLTTQDQLCTKGVFSSFAYNSTINQWTWLCRNTVWISVECSAEKEHIWVDIPTVGEDIEDFVEWVTYRNEWSLDSFLWNDCVPWFDDTPYQTPEEWYCGDGIVNNWEYCDPNDERETHWWNWWCSSSCEPIVVDEPVCNEEYDRKRSSNLTQNLPLCTIWIVNSFAYSNHKWTWNCENTLWSWVGCESTEKYCGDWMLDEWETCDPNDARHRNRWNVWCSEWCEAITEDDPECNPLYNWQTVSNLNAQSQLCTKWTSISFTYNESSRLWTRRCENILWNSVQCAANKEESSGNNNQGENDDLNLSLETKLCLNKCTEIRDAKNYSDALTCYAKCFCQSVEWPTDREWLERNATWWLLTYLDSTLWLWPIFKLEFCIQPVASHKLETSKKANSVEVVMTEINNVLQDLKNSGQLLKHKRTKEYMEAWYSLNWFSSLSFSIHSTTKKSSKSKTEKTEKDTQEELNKTLETNILWFSENDWNKYVIKGSTQEPMNEVNISEVSRTLDINRLVGMDSEFTDFLQTNVDFWLSVHEALQDMKETVDALYKKK